MGNNYFFVTVFALFIAFLTSCSPSKTEMLCANEWEVDVEKQKNAMLDEILSKTEGKSRQDALKMVNTVFEQMPTITYKFYNTNQVVIRTAGGREEGTWTLSEDGQYLKIKTPARDAKLEILELTDQVFKMKNTDVNESQKVELRAKKKY